MKSKKFTTRWFYTSCQSRKEYKHTWFSGIKEKETFTATTPDVQDLAECIERAYNELDQDGYDVVEVIPLNIGSAEPCSQQNGTYVGHVGYSTTRGVIVVGRLRDN